jgi:hypothetical protein
MAVDLYGLQTPFPFEPGTTGTEMVQQGAETSATAIKQMQAAAAEGDVDAYNTANELYNVGQQQMNQGFATQAEEAAAADSEAMWATLGELAGPVAVGAAVIVGCAIVICNNPGYPKNKPLFYGK